MEDGRGGLYFLNELSGYPESYSGSSYSPLAKVPVQGYLTAEEDKVGFSSQTELGRLALFRRVRFRRRTTNDHSLVRRLFENLGCRLNSMLLNRWLVLWLSATLALPCKAVSPCPSRASSMEATQNCAEAASTRNP